jgi:phenylalanyl-tRNA synthetase beta chain
MRVSLNWLRDFVDIRLSVDDLAELLTMSGLEVEAKEPRGRSLKDVVAAKVVSVRQHPLSDKLFLCDVDTGDRVVQVVCGAPNTKVGVVAPMALPGTLLPGGIKVEESRIRGEVSVGMLLAEDEMALTEDHTGLMVLPDDLRPGSSVAEALSLEDWALEIAITPNRPDCASVLGIAREIAALTGQKLRRPAIRLRESDRPVDGLTSVTISDPAGCPRYAAGVVLGVELQPSPFWLRYRLFVSGVRSINNVVDVTNYVLLETGQPLHAFDYDRLIQNRIVVRLAGEGESFTTLDGKTHMLSRENLMICDAERPVALAGIMGGLNSEIFSGSRNVLIESAYFDPKTVRRGAKRLGISTEASYRFERGVDIEGIPSALRRAMMLISELAGGEVINGIIDNYPKPPLFPQIDLKVEKTNRFLGTNLSGETIGSYLCALEMQVDRLDSSTLRVKPPSFRIDITRDWDLMEEVARIEGYDRIPVTMPAIKPSEEEDARETIIGEKLRDVMMGIGFTEMISYSFISADSADLLDPKAEGPLKSSVRLLNPLSTDQSVMRTSLVPGFMACLKTNFSYGENDLRFFEWGKVFNRLSQAELPEEKYCLCAVMTGLANPKEWFRDSRPVDFYDLKGAAVGLLNAFGFRNCEFQMAKVPPWYESSGSCSIQLSGEALGTMGRVAKEVLQRFGLETESVYLLEIDGSILLEKITDDKRFEPLPKFPPVLRDMSIVVKRAIKSASVSEIVKREGGALVESVTLFDVYEGGKIPPSEKALAFRITYRSKEGTLDGGDVNRLHEAIVNRIGKETGGRLREA